ncbi:MAG: hypothetical protein HFI06_05160 [Eubacterium sp.]|nr:hypothetical protein [Eubacterium sp.]
MFPAKSYGFPAFRFLSIMHKMYFFVEFEIVPPGVYCGRMWKVIHLWKSRKIEKNSVIHELIHIIHKNVHGFVVYILDNYWKKQTYGLLDYNKVDNPAKKPKN